jgi:O-antigen/teichoic acid export membrane protein
MVVVQTVFNFVTLGLNVFYCKNKIHIRVKFARVNWGFLKEVSIYSFWIFLNVIMDRIYWSTGQFVLGVTSGTVAVSVFAVAIQLEGIYMMFSGAISGVFLPRVTAMVAKKDDNKNISDLFIRTGRIQYIILSFILCGFIVFGRQFIHIWAGPVYDDAYIITLLFFISLTIPLVQNLGITILQARNEMKFRSLVYITIAVISLVFQIPLAKLYGGVGVSISIASALIIGQGVVMNIYYYKKQKLDIITFFKEISKMSIIPIIVTILFLVIDNIIDIKISISSLILEIAIFSIIYFPLLWKFSMNSYERNMLSRPILNIIIRADKN